MTWHRRRDVRRRIHGGLALLGVITTAPSLLTACSPSRHGAAATTTVVTETSTTAVATTTAGRVDSTTQPEPTTTSITSAPPGAFDRADALLRQRVAAAGLGSGMLTVGRPDGTLIHVDTVGAMAASTPLRVASSTKWLTTATFMTFVDAGVIGLDDDIARWLPEFAHDHPVVTPRELLDHTSGIRDQRCETDWTPLATCVAEVAAAPRAFPSGSRFAYGNSDFQVVGRLIEVLGGADFATVVQRRLTGPLDMTDTTWPHAPSAANPADGVRVSVADYAKFLDMMLNDGLY